MAISDAQYTAWLSTQSAMRCILVEAAVNSGGSEVTRYLSNRGFVTQAGDTPSNTSYKPVISGGVKLSETLSLDSNPTLSYGEIEIENKNGLLDSWLLDVWENRTITVLFGDASWAKSDFRIIFKGTLAGIDSSSRGTLNLSLRDSLQRLNTPITDAKLGGTTTNKDKLIPLTFGEVHNVTPLLTDPTLHDYQVHSGAIEDIIEVRDNGAPISVTKDLATGKFRLANSAVGTITCSLQGSKPIVYSNQIAENIKNLVKNYGIATNRLTDSDIDLTNFSNFAAANTAPIGVYYTDKTNLLEACQQLAGSVGAQVAMSRTGLLQLLRIDFPPSGTPVEITKTHIEDMKFSVDSKLSVQSAIQIGYCKNYTVENNLQTVVPEEHKSLYAQEWLTTTSVDNVVAATYKLSTEPNQKDTQLLTTSDAAAEATRRLNIVKQQRIVYKMTCFASMLQLSLGQAVRITYDRYGFNSGVTGVVVGLEPDWMNGKINVKVMV